MSDFADLARRALRDGALNADDRSRVDRSTEQPSRVDAGTVEALGRVLAAYRRLDDVLSPESLIPATLAHVEDVTRMLKGARGPYREQLTAVASEFAQFGGWMLAQVRRDDEAVALLTQALELADAIDDGTLAAQALNFRGYLARRQGRQQGVARWYAAAAHTPGAVWRRSGRPTTR